MVRGTGPITGPIRALALSWARLFRHISSFSVGQAHAAVQGVLCFCSSSLRSNTDIGPSAACLFGNNALVFRRQRMSCPGRRRTSVPVTAHQRSGPTAPLALPPSCHPALTSTRAQYPVDGDSL